MVCQLALSPGICHNSVCAFPQLLPAIFSFLEGALLHYSFKGYRKDAH